jgi:4-hydroxybenzoate polyprenyl transferase
MNNKIKNYIDLIRIKQPIGILLLFIPCLQAISLSAKKLPDFNLFLFIKITSLFFIGSILMRSAGCIINDLIDKKFDISVKRTKNRPIANKKISTQESIALMLFLLLFSLIILFQFNLITIFAGFFATLLVALYPLMKRITNYPQAFLGITFNFGIIMVNLEIFDQIDFDFLILYFSCTIWTLIYDTIYAYQDILDDIEIGLKSSAIKFGKNPKNIFYFLSLIMFSCLVFIGINNNFSGMFFLLILLTLLFLLQKIYKCNFENPNDCFLVFKDNSCIGFLIFCAISCG